MAMWRLRLRFTAEDPRAAGRADVGLRCLSAALFRSQGVRHNTQVCLSFEQSGHTLEVSGALVRGPPVPRPVPGGQAWCPTSRGWRSACARRSTAARRRTQRPTRRPTAPAPCGAWRSDSAPRAVR